MVLLCLESWTSQWRHPVIKVRYSTIQFWPVEKASFVYQHQCNRGLKPRPCPRDLNLVTDCKLRWCGPTNWIINDSDFKPSEFDRWLRSASDSNDDIVLRILYRWYCIDDCGFNINLIDENQSFLITCWLKDWYKSIKRSKESIKRSILSIKRLKMSIYIKKVDIFWLFGSILTLLI